MSMDFITYAQNAEDVMLWRALREIERGFYIDVGAQDPIVDSVTKAFYERGWHGINIEPVEHWYERLVHDRPHDINLRLAASDHSGEMNLFEIEATGL
ncbi:MAG TPA: FkbM family methyltransferase, partial [Nevskiaceae bacterium]|nr:FkbM family methyltransferase [Nevskiaceae bacterium]